MTSAMGWMVWAGCGVPKASTTEGSRATLSATPISRPLYASRSCCSCIRMVTAPTAVRTASTMPSCSATSWKRKGIL